MSQKVLPRGISLDPAEEATARSLILALLYRYASLAREHANGDYSEFEKIFEKDGKIRFPDGRELPPSQLAEVVRDGGPKYLRHHLTTVDIQFVSAEEAHCQGYVIVITDQCAPDHWGQWNDVVKKQADGRWLFKEKAVVVGGMNPEGWLASVSPKGFEK